MKTFQFIKEGYSIARNSLRAHGSRTFLTTLGVAIGIFAITIIFTLVNSLTYNLSKNINALGSNTLFVSRMPWSNADMDNWQKLAARPPVSYTDFKKLDRSLSGIEGLAFRVSYGSNTLKFKSSSVSSVEVMGITRDYAWLNNFEFDAGRPFTEIEAQSGRGVCILGKNTSDALFPGINPIDKTIRVNGKKMRIIGVLQRKGTDVFGNTIDDQCFIPYTLGLKVFKVKKERQDGMIMARTHSVDNLPIVEGEIIALLRAERGLRPQKEDDFSVNRPEMITELVGEVTGYLKIGGIIISIFSVIVGGFGIGNIMFATVKERTFEIGLQKALGATRGFIKFQFLTEAIILCLIGGAVGLALNFGFSALLEFLLSFSGTDFEFVVDMNSVMIGVGLSFFIGLISGYIPSVMAAKLDPVEAMRG